MKLINFIKTFWLRSIIATALSFVLVNQVYADVNGEYLVGLNITANGIEIKTGNLTIDTPGVLTMAGATGPTPVAGGGNFAALSVNGTPVSVAGAVNTATPQPTATPQTIPNTPTPIPTCAAGQFYQGLGYGCSVPTVVPTATPRATDTPAPTATAVAGCSGYPCGSGLTIIGPTFATSNTAITNSGTFYTGVTLGSALTNGKAYLLSGSISFSQSGSTTAADFVARLYDSTNSVEIWSGNITGDQVNATGGSIIISSIKYSGFVGTPTIVIQGLSSNTNETITATALGGGGANKATMIQAVQVS